MEEVEEFEERLSSCPVPSRRFTSLLDVGKKDSSVSISVGEEEKGSRLRIGVRIARVTRARSVIAKKMP